MILFDKGGTVQIQAVVSIAYENGAFESFVRKGGGDILLADMPLDLAPDQLLRWYIDAGVDETIGDVAVDRFAVSTKPAVSPVAETRQKAAPAPVMAAPAMGHRPSSATAAHIAAECHTLAELRLALEVFDGAPAKRTALSTVFADGNPEAEVMVIGEAPTAEDDRQGLPFCGKPGKLLDNMLKSIGLSRAGAYITNVVPWRSVENPKPGHEEVAICMPFIARHIELIDPKLLILLGGVAAQALLARHEGVNRLRGHWFDYSSPGLPRPVPAMATFHPSYLLATPEAKRLAWRDLLMVRKRLDGGH